MKHQKQTTPLALLAITLVSASFAADPVETSLDSSFAKLEESVPGQFNIDARLRYEVFDLDNGVPANDRDGTSIRVRYGYTTPNFNGFTAMVEGESLSRVGGDVNDIHPADEAGDGTDLNQLWLQYADEDNGKVKLGRQIYTLDDHRFIGHVGWRQNIQTFDAATFDFTGVDQLSVKGFYLAEQHAVNGTHNELDAYGLNVTYQFEPYFNLTGFYYDTEGDDTNNGGISNETLGARATGTFKYDEIDFTYSASIAEQEDTGRAADYDATYYAGDLAGTYKGVKLGVGFEVLEPGFRTPLATLHKFNGFADVFLNASGTGIPQGLEDLYVYVGYTLPVGKGIPLTLTYHSFEPETGSGDYGDEIDLVASYKINKYLTAVTKYGHYDSDGGASGVGGADKDMFTLELNFKY